MIFNYFFKSPTFPIQHVANLIKTIKLNNLTQENILNLTEI